MYVIEFVGTGLFFFPFFGNDHSFNFFTGDRHLHCLFVLVLRPNLKAFEFQIKCAFSMHLVLYLNKRIILFERHENILLFVCYVAN